MSVTREYGRVVFICDMCGDHFDSGVEDFGEAFTDVRHEGWQTTKEVVRKTEEWRHYCADCKE